MKVVDIATEIYIEQGSPSTTTIPAIAYWVRTKVGWLNAQVYEELSINDALEIMNKGAEITPELVSIIKQAYKVYDLELQIKSLSLAIATDGILSVTDNLGGTSFTRVNRSEVMKTITQSRKDELKSFLQFCTFAGCW
jgi:hypothetical protein